MDKIVCKSEKKMDNLNSELIKQIFVVIGIGLLIGLQREIYYKLDNRKEFAGTRTFTLITLFGYLSAWVQTSVPFFLPLALIALSMLVLTAFIYKLYHDKQRGATTEVTALLSFMLGVIIYQGFWEIAIFLAVIVVVLLEFKSHFSIFEQHIEKQDTNAAALFLLITFVILPLLPNKTVDAWHVFNPYQTWLMVVLVAGISFMGYIAIKVLGSKRGIYLTGAFGGLVSSTAVTITLSKLYALRSIFLKNYTGAIAIASTLMYLRVLFEASIFNWTLAKQLAIPYLSATFVGTLFVYYLYTTSTASQEISQETIKNNPLELSQALKLGLLFGLILGAIGLFQEEFGRAGVYMVSALAGLTDVDAITLSLSKLADEKIKLGTAFYGIVMATSINSLVKLIIIFALGGKKIGSLMTLFYLLTIGIMLLSLLFL